MSNKTVYTFNKQSYEELIYDISLNIDNYQLIKVDNNLVGHSDTNYGISNIDKVDCYRTALSLFCDVEVDQFAYDILTDEEVMIVCKRAGIIVEIEERSI